MKKLLIIFFILLGIYFYRLSVTPNDNIAISNTSQVSHTNKLIINKNDDLTYSIPINEPIELDFCTKQQVFDIRKKYAAMTPQFIPNNYKPSNIVFDRITDGKPWWGLIGQDFYGPGEHSIDGLSEESRSINNPLLLFMLNPQLNISTININGPNIYPKPVSITFKPSQRTITVVYDISEYNTTADSFLKANAHEYFENNNAYTLQGLNARDFGYDFAYAYQSQNIVFDDYNDNLSTSVKQLQDFLHTGGSCGYPGDCNNGSPKQTYLDFKTLALPAQLGIKLWKKIPADKNSSADIYFILILQ